MRLALAAALLLAACHSTDATSPDVDADPDPDAYHPPGGAAYWPCYFWPDAVTKCAPKCANHTLLGREVFGEGNTCEIAPGVECDTHNMTGPAGEGGACCVVNGDRVELVACASQ